MQRDPNSGHYHSKALFLCPGHCFLWTSSFTPCNVSQVPSSHLQIKEPRLREAECGVDLRPGAGTTSLPVEDGFSGRASSLRSETSFLSGKPVGSS